MLNTIKFFSRYNNNILFNFEELNYQHIIYAKEITEIIKFLEKLEKKFDTDTIYTYYFRSYFTKRIEYGGLYLNLTAFLQYACVEFSEFQEDIKHELNMYC